MESLTDFIHWSFLAAFAIFVGLREVLARLLSTPEKFRLPSGDLAGLSINTAAIKSQSLIIYRKPDSGWRVRAFTLLPVVPFLAGVGLGMVPGMPVAPGIEKAVVEHGMIWAPSVYLAAAGIGSTWFTSVQVVRRFLKSK